MNVNDAFGRAKSETDEKAGEILKVLGKEIVSGNLAIVSGRHLESAKPLCLVIGS